MSHSDDICRCGHPKVLHYKNSDSLMSVPGCHFITDPQNNKTCGCGMKYEDETSSYLRFLELQLGT